MRVKEIYGKTLLLDMLPQHQVEYLPDDYDFPCYRVKVKWDGFWPKEPGFFYADIFVNDTMQIQRVERYKNNYKESKLIKMFPSVLEGAFDLLLEQSIR